MRKQLTALAAGSVLLAAAQSSFAGSVIIGPLSPTITLGSSCEASLTAPPDFGTWPTTAANLSNTPAGQISVKCSLGLQYAVLIDGGVYYDMFGAARRHMVGTNPVNKIQYRLRSNGADVGDVVSSIYPSYDNTYSETTWENAITATGNGNFQNYPLVAIVLITTSSKVVDDYYDTVAVLVQY